MAKRRKLSMRGDSPRLVAFGVDIGKRHVRGVDTVYFRDQAFVVGKWNRIGKTRSLKLKA